MLTVNGLVKRFGGFTAVNNVSFRVEKGEILGLIGPNGSGKSTIVNLICGLFAPTAGRVVFNGADISVLPPHARVTLGIARTFQNIRLFGQLTVWQNLWVAQNSGEQRKQNFLPRWLGGSRSAREEIDRTLENVIELFGTDRVRSPRGSRRLAREHDAGLRRGGRARLPLRRDRRARDR